MGEASDSAGISIVELGPVSSEVAYELGAQVFSIGWSADDYVWGEVAGGQILSEGRVAIADRGRHEVVVLGPDGAVQYVLGGAGAGPGEVGYLGALTRVGRDTLVVSDVGNGRLMLFHSDSLVASLPNRRHGLRVVGSGKARALILASSGYQPYTDRPWVTGSIARLDVATGRIDTISAFDWAPGLDLGITPDPFRGLGWLAARDGVVVTQRGDRAQFEILDEDGRLLRISRWKEDPTPATDSAWAVYAAALETRRDLWLGDFDADLNRARKAASSFLPYSSGVLVDDRGSAWISAYSADSVHPLRYRVFNRDGAWMGWVDLPARFRVLDVVGSRILGVMLDDLDVPTVVLHQLIG